MLSSSAPSLSSLFRLVHFGFAATHMAGSVDFSIRQALLGAVWKLWHSEVAVDTQQTSAHVVLGGGNLCIEKAEVKHFTAQNKKVCCELGRPQLSLKLYSIFIIVLVQFPLMQLRRCGALLPLRFVCVCVCDWYLTSNVTKLLNSTYFWFDLWRTPSNPLQIWWKALSI